MSRKIPSIPETSFDSSRQENGAASAVGSSASTIGLLLAGHHPLTLCGLSQVFEKEVDCVVLGVCTDSEAIVETVQQRQPDILILDLDRYGAFKILRRLQRSRLSIRVVVLAAASDDIDVTDAMRLGARAVVLKEQPPEVLVSCIRKVHRGDSLEGPGTGGLVTKLFRAGPSMRQATRQLTPREAEIARLAVLGISTRDIAARLDVKQGTVKIHLHSIYDKLNVGGRLGLILVARRHGLA